MKGVNKIGCNSCSPQWTWRSTGAWTTERQARQHSYTLRVGACHMHPCPGALCLLCCACASLAAHQLVGPACIHSLCRKEEAHSSARVTPTTPHHVPAMLLTDAQVHPTLASEQESLMHAREGLSHMQTLSMATQQLYVAVHELHAWRHVDDCTHNCQAEAMGSCTTLFGRSLHTTHTRSQHCNLCTRLWAVGTASQAAGIESSAFAKERRQHQCCMSASVMACTKDAMRR
jgi:hypothetical protein